MNLWCVVVLKNSTSRYERSKYIRHCKAACCRLVIEYYFLLEGLGR